MHISCLILNYNDFETTYALISKIKTYVVFNKIIIVDNCSTDGSYEKLCKLKTNKIQIISSKFNGGYGYGNNVGINYIKKEYNSNQILICNPDVVFSEELVEALSCILLEDKECAVASAKSINSKKDIETRSAWRIPTNKEIIFCNSKIMYKILKNTEDYFLKKAFYKKPGVHSVECVSGSLLMINTDLMIKYGMYDERFFLYCEESVIGYKLKKNGIKTKITNDFQYLHNHSVSIDKSIIKKNKKKILLSSRLEFLKIYKKINAFYIFLIKIYFFVVIKYEDKVIDKIKKIINNNS